MDADNNYVVDGYLFKNSEDAERAKQEYDKVQNLKNKIDIDNIEKLRSLYIRLAEKNYFRTPIGIGFLHELRDYLVENGVDQEIISVPVPDITVIKQNGADTLYKEKCDKLITVNDKLVITNRKLMISVVALAVAVIGMFFMIATNDNLGYFNAEEKVLDKYSSWQERLQSWEEELIEREEAIDEIEK